MQKTDLQSVEMLTTTEAATLLKCSRGAIIRSFEKGSIPGYKIPGSNHRRIRKDFVIKYLRDNGIDVPDWLIQPIEQEDQKIL